MNHQNAFIRSANEATSSGRPASQQAEADFQPERSLKEKANRQLRQILVEQTRGQLHFGEDVQALVTNGNADSRSQLLAFGRSLALQLAGKPPTEVKAIIDSEARKTLISSRNYKPKIAL